ncbi:hypothetical protein CO112_02070 [Candidatus Dojkabacteria bacterium CG_4_9_14_3_um_filter_150_Dojkabacteria_WS6_41_13]|uniref:Integrase catalytic domain-containing protein n=1 Tax=Candidatus Dojkabacteria bacterium CG_4_10_14_0_2_um_filter_Dojkabacteria_WS6_41_15 TaxID=2014249 RepID=A0A2M7W2J3_9BACT|nr:MAG: hypothetical protein COZ14_04590 [Candidatus Dojkabacteria bacterium CG_4_10_14_3_um_filter_Dojkabacteria_WS6_41_9]PJA14960.1 MAG: hypothetical protein COX64_01405 [Candidatus Dojkabacteria bacterium CG_4_10_14_0_2_um_filter_Dojkabacteria_WS6_41_15]PJB22882.1 MAG: hypothetical protein CO112_02070 [Candidatus Dojkabacteria bacterium CG_4_9_14_3_um_filter_150_Dojkabacteria_WS6_41_13]
MFRCGRTPGYEAPRPHRRGATAALERFETTGELAEEVYSYLYYYNNLRIHSAFCMAPKKYLEKCLKKRALDK